MSVVFEIETPLRLHFGMFAFGGAGRQFGGAGALVGRAGPRVRVSHDARLTAEGPLCERALAFARRWAHFSGLEGAPACRIEVVSAPPEHSGLGVGTQLALAVAMGLNLLFERPTPGPAELALSVSRGLRSAIGTYGFAHGGFIVEQGKLPGEKISPLDFHCDLPADWRFVLICPCGSQGLAGREEQEAFEKLPAVPQTVSHRLEAEVRQRLAPAAALADFESFSESVYQFGRTAGECFADRQGGPYNGPLLAEIVDTLRDWEIRGVGQSSWGPTLFALLPHEKDFPDLAARLRERFRAAELRIECHPPNNTGALVLVRQEETIAAQQAPA